ncbi:hypothetical protein [Pseudomonas sp. CBZ-4]|uniref:hypothetical protein n=1 Tax=Pseudomonas sp. CBZ-4 TaxID=1163065 RepID=UPI0012FB9D6D|nr:hypothetical protein [Pseudomonas sp. CBZ-4]
MSLSVNNPPSVKVDTSTLDQSAVTPHRGRFSSTAHLGRAPFRHDSSQVAHGDVMLNANAFAKLFDMFEAVFKAVRDMFAGKNIAADATHLPKVAPGADTALKVKPEAQSQPKVMPEAGKLPSISITPAPVVPVAPNVHKPEVNMAHDAASQVKVEVNVNNCHCPGTHVRRGSDLNVLRPMPGTDPRAEIVPLVPRVVPHPETTPGVVPKLDIAPKLEVVSPPVATVVPKTDLKPDWVAKSDRPPLPAVAPMPTPAVKPETETRPKVDPDAPLPRPEPDLTSPGPAQDIFDRRDWYSGTRKKYPF